MSNPNKENYKRFREKKKFFFSSNTLKIVFLQQALPFKRVRSV